LRRGLAADVVLVDRPAPDALGYYRAALEHRGEPPQHERLEYLTDLVCHHTATYSLLLATRLDSAIALGSNKARNGDPQFRALADLHIHAVLDQVGVSYRPLPAHEHHAGVAAVLEACGIAPAAGKGSTGVRLPPGSSGRGNQHLLRRSQPPPSGTLSLATGAGG
jgi:hypothetical protein